MVLHGKKLVLFFCLFFMQYSFAQSNEEKVWDLLLQNQRAEARKLYDKSFKNSDKKSLEVFLLGEIIDEENGKIDFQEEFVTQFSKYEDSKYYLTPLIKKPFLIDDILDVGFNNTTYAKLDMLASHTLYENNPMIIYYKAVADRNRRNFDGYLSGIKKLNSLMNWQLCGVFENLNDSGIDIEYEPEFYPKNDKLFDGNSNGQLGWYNPAIPINEGYQIFSNEQEYGNGIMYSQLFADNPENQTVVFNFGMSGSLKLFINDIEVYVNTINKMSDLNAYQVKITLPKGMNRILVKSSIQSGSYFFLSLTNEQQQNIKNITYHNTYKPYNTSTLASLAVEELTPDYELYFAQKIKENPNHVFYQLMLFDAYMHNKKVELAEDIIHDLDTKYPNSSLIKTRLVKLYSFKEEGAKVNEIIKNIERNDADYYYNIAVKAADNNWLTSVNITELESYRDKAKKLISPLFYELYSILINARNSKIDEMVKNIDAILSMSNYREFYIVKFSPFYDTLENDKQKTIDLLEELVSKRDNFMAVSKLVDYYYAANRKEDVKKLLYERRTNVPYFTSIIMDYINVLIDEKNYSEAMKEIDLALALYPYSFLLLEKKGIVYHYMNNEKEAEKYIRKSLEHNAENGTLRKQLYDIKKIKDEIEEIDVKDKYGLIKERKNSALKSDYGVVTLFDQYIVNIFPEGGMKSKVVLIYEITSENGIDELKEYSLNTYGVNFIKTEIVKSDGSVVPAERGNGVLVFSNLKVGDVVHIDYEVYSNSTGRFYKDFNVDCYFTSIYPSVETIFTIINPSDVTYQYKLFNGDIKPVVKKSNNKVYTTWRRTNVEAIPLLESFSKPYNDLTNTIQVSSIKSWKEIANWYADLVKKTLRTDKVTRATFDKLFPNGVQSMSQEQIARKIYQYICDNIKYSSLDFRQSGYVPQKPSKTITTQLGDCKDVSTLFVALSELAGIQSNLVLVSTNDNSNSGMALPSKNFNHCIVKTSLDGKDYFLELTNKYLPFNSLPVSLYKANVLVVSFDKSVNETATITQISFENTVKNYIETNLDVFVTDAKINYNLDSKISGSIQTYYSEMFDNSTTEEVRKKEFEEQFQSLMKKTITLDSSSLKKHDSNDEFINFSMQFQLNEKLKNVGNLKLIDIPFIYNVYSRNVISSESRNYDIHYITYEDSFSYLNTITFHLADGKKFTDIPENFSASFKNHSYLLSFELVEPGKLKVTRKVNSPWDDIVVKDYPEYKKYVEEVLTAEEQVLGFK
jgi:hypothetical protein